MKAAQAYRGHFLPKKCIGKRTLRECSTSGERDDNIVLIEVDSDDFGDVIILDVPESFQEKFRKNQDPHVIELDDEDGDDVSNTSRRDMNVNSTTSTKYSPTSSPPSSNPSFPTASVTCADDGDRLFANEGNTPVKLSKSKRTYSGKSSSRNRYGLTPDSESSSESDCSDCELMEGSSGKLREEWEKAFSNRRREPFNRSNEESTPAQSESASQQSYSSVDSHESDYFQQDNDTEDLDVLLRGFSSNGATEEKPFQEFELSSPPIDCKEQKVGTPSVPFNDSIHCQNSEPECSSGQINILIDRQKIKETDEYKRAMEEEWASRQQQLQRQAEEAQRLRVKKRAEKMRIMDNERRQKQRLEEIRETRRKDEENLNMKDKLRAEVKKELHMLEIMCADMVSLLRCLGIPIPPFPSSSEVQAAYKRACLKFHPDRLSSMDLRQQVEAEEKFKLISTMKEKFLK